MDNPDHNMDVPAKRARCECCCEPFYFPRHSSTCIPCAYGISPKSIRCFLCCLPGGELTRTLDDRWVHLVCGLIATDFADDYDMEMPQKRRITAPPKYLQIDMPKTALDVKCSKCIGKKEPMYTVECAACMKRVHFACFLKDPDWIFAGRFECGCRKPSFPPPVPSLLQPKLHTSKPQKTQCQYHEPICVFSIQVTATSNILKLVFKEIIAMDEFRMFRTETAHKPFLLSEKLVRSK